MATKIETKLKRRGDNLRVCLVSGFDFIQTFVCLFRKGIPNFGGLVFKLWGPACFFTGVLLIHKIFRNPARIRYHDL